MSELIDADVISIGFDLAWEARRLAGESLPAIADTYATAVRVGQTACVAYKAKPWGVIGVQAYSEYELAGGILKHIDHENIGIADIFMESRYHSVISTGELLCDRKLHEIGSSGLISATISRETTSIVYEIEDEGSREPLGADVISDALGQDHLPDGETTQQIHNNEKLDRLYALLHTLPKGDSMESRLVQEIDRLDFSGEAPSRELLHTSKRGLKLLLAHLKLLEPEDKLGLVSDNADI